MNINGKLVDIHNRTIFSAEIQMEGKTIRSIKPNSHRGRGFILPGFIDAHTHIESSLLPPSEYARLAVRHGTIAALCDPHEIANVLGISGVEYMLDEARKSPFKFYFGAPSCVPTTVMETSGGALDQEEVRELLMLSEVKCLGSVMNIQDVLEENPEIMAKTAHAKQLGKKIDGHAPNLFGEDLAKYYQVGIETDSTCMTLTEARERQSLGMKIFITPENFTTVFPLLQEFPEDCMLCSGHLYPNNLLLGHINLLIKQALQNKMDPFDLFQSASLVPVEHYDLEMGLLREGDPADFIVVDSLESLRVLETYIDGACVFKETTLIPRIHSPIINRFQTGSKTPADFTIAAQEGTMKVIEALDQQQVTKRLDILPKIEHGQVVSDLDQDILKIAVVNRYKDAPPSVGFVKDFGLKKGAIASSIAHDAHNLIAVGTNDEDLCSAINALIEKKGGLALVHDGNTQILPLPIAGLMSPLDGEEVARLYGDLDEAAKTLGSALSAPFKTLAMMAFLVIPELKISDKGLFDSKAFVPTSLFERSL